MFPFLLVVLAETASAHVTLRSAQPLRPGGGYATVTLNVPNEWVVENTKVTLEVPDAFLQAGGRISSIEYPPGWTVTVEKEDKPAEIYKNEHDERAKRDAEKAPGSGPEATSDAEKHGQEMLDEMRRKWIKKISFEGGTIPPEGFKTFQLSFQLPEQPGRFRFPSVQTYADGKEVSWSELVEGADHPAPTLAVEDPSRLPQYAAAAAALLVILAGWKWFARRNRERKRI